MKKDTLQISLEPELTALVNQAVRRTGLSKSEVVRQGPAQGGARNCPRLKGSPKRRTLVDALLDMKGLEIPDRRC